MKICRFDDNRLGIVEGTVVRDVSAALDCLPRHGYPLPNYDPLIANLPRLRARIEAIAPHCRTRPLADIRLLSPIANPGKIIAAPVNYKKHLEEARAQPQIHHDNQVAEIQRIGLFLKANSSLVGPAEGVALQHPDRRNDHEAEVVVVIGKSGKSIRRGDASGYIAGYCIGLDMTVRGPEERSLRKSIDSYSVLGPWLVTADANTRDLIIGIPELIEYASSFYTLHPGDVIFTGTPEGVGPVLPGDRIVVELQGVGRMEVAVRSECSSNSQKT
jgi:2,4-diketo-3-deoxy-L-fuconate hydrolase